MVTFIKIRSHRRKFSNSDSVEPKEYLLHSPEKLQPIKCSVNFERVQLIVHFSANAFYAGTIHNMKYVASYSPNSR
jgi:hypothetical protein